MGLPAGRAGARSPYRGDGMREAGQSRDWRPDVGSRDWGAGSETFLPTLVIAGFGVWLPEETVSSPLPHGPGTTAEEMSRDTVVMEVLTAPGLEPSSLLLSEVSQRVCSGPGCKQDGSGGCLNGAHSWAGERVERQMLTKCQEGRK